MSRQPPRPVTTRAERRVSLVPHRRQRVGGNVRTTVGGCRGQRDSRRVRQHRRPTSRALSSPGRDGNRPHAVSKSMLSHQAQSVLKSRRSHQRTSHYESRRHAPGDGRRGHRRLQRRRRLWQAPSTSPCAGPRPRAPNWRATSCRQSNRRSRRRRGSTTTFHSPVGRTAETCA